VTTILVPASLDSIFISPQLAHPLAHAPMPTPDPAD